uniref:Uncharacterized protein n=1 Tax=Oryza rufipogon TaxID=4529 RepID=A0A0E0RI18_ORYRU
MAIHLSLRVAPPDLQQGGNSRISYFLVPINKTSPFSSLFRNRYRNWCFFYFVYVSDWGISGKAYVGYLSASCRTGSYFNPCWTDRYTNNKVSSQLVEYIASTWEY